MKTAGAIDTKLGRPIVHERALAYTDPEVKRAKDKVTVRLSAPFALAVRGVKLSRSKVLFCSDGWQVKYLDPWTIRPSRLAL